jgi:transcriptional regulator with XRE-family HTH domain
MTKPAPPPEAVIIRLARKAAGLSVASAAAKLKAQGIRISIARWSQIENGYETRPWGVRAVRGRDDTIAHMADSVGVTADRLVEAGRPDAASVLREIMFQREGKAPPLPELVREHWDDPAVRRVWETPNMPDGVKLGMITYYLASQKDASDNGEASA